MSAGGSGFSEGLGECASLVRDVDWAATPLGPITTWPPSLRATVANVLDTRQAMLLFWGPALIQIYNDAFVPSFGLGKHPAAMGQRAPECWADAWPVVGAQIDAVMTRGEPAWFENALVPIHRNGRMEEVFWTYSYSAAHDDEGAIHGTLVIVTETTGHVVGARRLEALAALGSSLATTTSYEGAFDALTRVAERWPNDLPFVVVCSACDAERAERSIVDGKRSGPLWPEPVTTIVTSPVGTNQQALLVGVSPRLPFDDGYRGYVAQVVEQLTSALARIDIIIALEAASRTKDEFLAMLGHELRNPLAPIVTALELMNARDGTARPPERAVIERQVKHVVRLVDDLLDVSKITRGVLTIDRRRIDIAVVLAGAIEISMPLVQQRRHELETHVPPGIIVDADGARLIQVLANLVTNAARYTPEGGRIRVTVTADDRVVSIEVADNGTGITAELLPHVFDTFVQGARRADRAEGGLGLGLAIVKSLVGLHDGDVSAQSDGVGRGSRFVVRLPRASAQPATAARVAETVTRVIEPQRVLIVDDNQDAADLLGQIVRRRGHEVTVVHDPAAALAVLGVWYPEVALLDIGLPGMDGYELAERMRKIVPMCRLIALTGYGQDSDRERTERAGFAAHLVKPVKIDTLLSLIA